MVYDCFMFFNELDILLMRMNILDEVVDRFVIAEASVTFSGNEKPMFFRKNREKFKAFESKIIYVPVTEDAPSLNPFERDEFQKNHLKRGLEGCSDSDVIIFSDVDEIPNPEAIKLVLTDFRPNTVYHLAQDYFLGYLNLKNIDGSLLAFCGEFDEIADKKWLGTKICSYGFLQNKTMVSLRYPEMKECGIRVENGGWHFSYMGGPKEWSAEQRVSRKIDAAAHQEFNNNKNSKAVIAKRLKTQTDALGREAEFSVIAIDGAYPQYLIEHLDEYKYLVAPTPNALRSLRIKASRFYRNNKTAFRNYMAKPPEFVVFFRSPIQTIKRHFFKKKNEKE